MNNRWRLVPVRVSRGLSCIDRGLDVAGAYRRHRGRVGAVALRASRAQARQLGLGCHYLGGYDRCDRILVMAVARLIA